MSEQTNLTEQRTDFNSPALVDTYSQYPFELVSASGMEVTDSSGKTYVDFYGGHAVCLLGHSPQEVVDAISTQGKKFMFYSNLAFIPIREAAARSLLEFGQFRAHQVFFCNSGGEANENALKIAVKVTGRKNVVAFSRGFHGRTLMAASATDHPDWHEYLKGWVGPVTFIRPNEQADLAAITNETAAVILEPIQSIGGVIEFSEEFLQALRIRCDDVGAKLIFDEVQTGMGRTGAPFVSGFFGAPPDMTTLAKGLGAGFPVGAVIMTQAVASKLKKGDIAATFGGGPMAMAAVMKTVEVLERDKLVEHAKQIGDYVRKTFKGIASSVLGRGCLLGLKMKGKSGKEIQQKLFSRGIITGVCSDSEVVHLLPALIVQKEHIDFLKSNLIQVLAEL